MKRWGLAKLTKRAASIILVLVVVALYSGWLIKISNGKAAVLSGYQVTNFFDGDTIAVNMDGHSETIRFIGVDTPETHKPNTAVQCFGVEASEFTKKKIGKGRVTLVSDPLSTNRDRYNRLLRYVYLENGELLNLDLVKSGHGFAYTSFPFSKAQEFSISEKQAMDQKIGLWKICQPEKTKYGTYQSNAL